MAAIDDEKLKTAAQEFAESVPKDYIMFRYKKLDIDVCLLHLSFLSTINMPGCLTMNFK